MYTEQTKRPSCLIVGAGPGVGEAIARRFGDDGYSIGLVSRTADALSAMTSRLEARGAATHSVAADAGDESALRSAMETLMARSGGCDVLVYNAAVLRSAHPLDLTRDEIKREFAVNVLGAHTAVSAVVPEMKKKNRGAILLTGGGLALEPYPEWTSLALGKAALRSYALSLFKELHPQGIHVSVLAICGIVERNGPFDPDLIAEEYFRVATQPRGLADREIIFQPEGTDPYYNDAERKHGATTMPPQHVVQLQRPQD